MDAVRACAGSDFPSRSCAGANVALRPTHASALDDERNDQVPRYCVFCEIAAHREPADILYEDDEVMVFRNRLRWVPIMLLAIHKQHETQSELWNDMGRVGEIAVKVAEEHCPQGFRLLSNFGYDGMQSQDHAHVHILGGMFLGEYA